jgi:hypothetical protein
MPTDMSELGFQPGNEPSLLEGIGELIDESIRISTHSTVNGEPRTVNCEPLTCPNDL